MCFMAESLSKELRIKSSLWKNILKEKPEESFEYLCKVEKKNACDFIKK